MSRYVCRIHVSIIPPNDTSTVCFVMLHGEIVDPGTVADDRSFAQRLRPTTSGNFMQCYTYSAGAYRINNSIIPSIAVLEQLVCLAAESLNVTRRPNRSEYLSQVTRDRDWSNATHRGGGPCFDGFVKSFTEWV